MAKDPNFGKVYNKHLGRYDTDAEHLRRQHNWTVADNAADKAEKYKKAGKKKESESYYKTAGKYFEKAGEFWEAARMYNFAGISRKKAFEAAGKSYETIGDLWGAARMYKKAGMQKEAFITEGKAFENQKDFFSAAYSYKRAGMDDKTKEMIAKEAKKSNRSIDNIVIPLFLLGVLGTIVSLLSRPGIFGIGSKTQLNAQLAPPILTYQTYIIYGFVVLLIVGASYFIAKKLRK